MISLHKKTAAISLGILTFIVLLLALILYQKRAHNNSPLLKLRSEEQLMIAENPEKAYKNLKDKYSKKDISSQHNAAHLFGEDLFTVKGLSGIHICDEMFSYGCYHGFFSKAVALNGLRIVGQLDKECESWAQRGRCQHGIGHGILEFFGTNDRLIDALKECDKLRVFSKYAGCSGGVFMEYNFRTERDRGKSGPRQMTSDNLQTPCSSLPEKYMESCYFYQPQWWDSIFESDFKKIGSLCNTLQSDSLRLSCFQGSGNIIGPRQEFDVERSLGKCNEITYDQGRLYCKIGLARILMTGDLKKEEALQICSQLPPPQNALCRKEISL